MNLGGTVHLTKTGGCVLIGAVIILTIYLLPNKNVDFSKINTGKINLNQLLSVAIQAAENGGTEVVHLLNKIIISNKGKTKEGANDSVTTADFNSHCVMTNTIKKFFPTLKVVSEEAVICDNTARDHNLNLTLVQVNEQYVDQKDITIWIDPLDATQEYTEKLTSYVTTMVCIAIKDKPVIGVIHKPFSKATFWAWVQNGYSSNIIPKPRAGENKYKFIVSRSHMGEVEEKIHSMFKDKAGEIITAGGAGYKVLEVVNGNADIYLHVTAIKKWDICAGNAILNAIGGNMKTLHGQEIDYSDHKNPKNEHGIIASTLEIGYN